MDQQTRQQQTVLMKIIMKHTLATLLTAPQLVILADESSARPAKSAVRLPKRMGMLDPTALCFGSFTERKVQTLETQTRLSKEKQTSMKNNNSLLTSLLPACLVFLVGAPEAAQAELPHVVQTMFESRCLDCHDADSKKGNLDLTALKPDFGDAGTFGLWLKVHDRIASGEMPPKKKARPEAVEVKAVTAWLAESLVKAERTRLDGESRTGVRRLTRAEYENTVRDLFDLPGLALQSGLPADGSAHGFDKNSDALDISHVNLAKYLEAADKTLDLAIASQPQAPERQTHRISLARHVYLILMNGDAVMLKDQMRDTTFPASGEHYHVGPGEHVSLARESVKNGASVGVFRHEDESFKPYFYDFAAIYSGRYRLRASFWSFQWDKGEVLPARGTEAARLDVVHLEGDGRGGGHPSDVLGYFDAPSLKPQVHEFETWLNFKDTIGFNTASLAPVVNYTRKGRAMAFTGPGIASDWLEIDGPIHEAWPPQSHRRLFGDLPITEFKPEENRDIRKPVRKLLRQETQAPNRPDTTKGIWTVRSEQPLADADRLLADFLPRAFRREVEASVRKEYLAQVEARLKEGDCFETAMRSAYRMALCSPDFLYRIEPAGRLDDAALASRLSYFLWNSMPDAALMKLAAEGKLRERDVLDSEIKRLLSDSKSQRFIEDFLGQWLKLRAIGANDPDKKLYPEFSGYLQGSMVAETHAYFRELLERDLNARHLVKSDFAMLNEKLAVHYGISGVSGSEIRRVKLPAGSPRGGFLTQASILKVTANGTTTSPVPRGAFVMARLLGRPPEPPPPNTPAVEPDVQGATTIREQLDKHRADASCASCHANIDPPGFALEAFDVIGGFRDRYRSIGEGDPAPRGSIDPFIGISFKLGPKVDASGQLPDERQFAGISGLQDLLSGDTRALLHNLAKQFLIYATGRDIAFSDRAALDGIVTCTEKRGGGIRTLIQEIVLSDLFQTH